MCEVKEPVYSRPPIGSLRTLSKVLSIREEKLLKVASNRNNYRVAGKKRKKDGSVRVIWEAREPLKIVQRRITDRILKVVDYPYYLQGALSGRDYVTNATLHSGKKAVISLDIKQFFPSCSEATIYSIWLKFFKFPHEVASLLTQLTMRKGELPQGASSSSFLANLVFFRDEGKITEDLNSVGLKYSRFVDDITISSGSRIDDSRKELAIRSVLRLISPLGFGLHRGKLQIANRSESMEVHRLNVKTRKPTLFRKKRSQIRARVKEIELQAAQSREGKAYKKQFHSARGQAALLKRFHKTQGQMLLKRLSRIQPKPSEAEVLELRRAVSKLCRANPCSKGTKKFKRDLMRVKQGIGELKRFRPREARKLRNQLRDSNAS